MQNSGGSSRARRGLVDDGADAGSERAVFYDLDAGSRRSAMQLAAARPKAEPAAAKSHATATTGAARKRLAPSGAATSTNASAVLHRPKELFQPTSLLQLDALSDGDGHESDDGDANPFASLLQPRTQPQLAQHDEDSAAALNSASDGDNHDDELISSGSSQPVARAKRTTPSQVGPRSSASVSRSSSAHSPFIRARLTSAKPVAAAHATVEAADARPSRWSQRSSVSSAKTLASRRRASGTKRSDRTSASTVRRSSLSMDSQPSTTQDDAGDSPRAPPKRRLTDVLMRATLLSQQKQEPTERSQSLEQASQSAAPPVEPDDAIADTAVEMRAEAFEMQFFSPSKLASAAASRRRSLKPESAAAASKIRGELGDAIARAIRKTTRDLTLLHAHGQTLLEQQHRDGDGLRLDRVQDRESTVVRLLRQRRQSAETGDRVVFDATVDDLSAGLAAALPCPVNTRVRVAFSAQTASQLSLERHARVRIYAPFHFIPLEQAPGSAPRRSPPKWLVLGTALSELVEA